MKNPSRKSLAVFLGIGLSVIFSLVYFGVNFVRAATVTWDGGGTDETCGGGAGDGNKWSCGANWSGDVAPGASDVATFDGTSTKNATIDSSISVLGIDVNSGYTGVITQGTGNTVTVGGSNFDISDGTFTGGDSTITINGNFTVSGGTFTSTTGNLSIAGDLVVSSGSFDPSTGTVTAVGTTFKTWNVNVTETFNNLTISLSAGDLTVASGDTFITSGTLTLTTGAVYTGTLEAQGDVSQGSGFSGGTATIEFGNDSSSQTFSIAGGTVPRIELDDPDDANDSITVTSATTFSNMTIAAGFSGTVPLTNTGDNLLTFTNWIQAAGTYDASSQTAWNIRILTISGGTFTPPVTVTIIGGGFDTWNVDVTETFNNLTIGFLGCCDLTIAAGDTLVTTGTLSLTNGSVYYDTATLEAQGDVTIGAGWDGGPVLLKFTGSAVQTFDLTGGTGTFNGDITVDKSGGQVNLASALVMDAGGQDLTIAEGTMDIAGQNLTATGGSFTVQDGGVFELFGSETISLAVGQPTLNSGSTVRFTGDGDAAGDTYTVTTLKNAYHHLTINSTDGATDTFQLGSAIDMNGNFTVSAGTFDVTGTDYQMNVAGNWSNSGSFQANNGLVVLDGTDQTLSGSTTFYTFTKTVSSAATLTFPASTTQTFGDTMTLQGNSTSDRLALRSSSTGTKAKIDPQGTRTVSYLDVKDNDNDNASSLSCFTGCLNSGNNENWVFLGATVSAISGNTTEAGGTATFTVVLNTEPTADVVIDLDSDDTSEGTVDTTQLTFTDLNWDTPQTVTVTGQNDDVDDGDIAYTIVLDAMVSADLDYNGLDPDDVAVTNTDNDTAGVSTSVISGDTTEAGGTATFTIVLDSEPTGNVEIDSASSDNTEGSVTSGATLTFTSGNWDTPQTVTVTGQDDDVDDGDIAYTIVVTVDAGNTADAVYDAIDPDDVAVTNTDDDTADVLITESGGSTDISEIGETSDMYDVVLTSEPTATVTITLTDDADANASPSPLTFTTGNWDEPQTVTVTAVDDDLDETNPHTATISHDATSADSTYDGISIDDVLANVTDNDTSDFTVSAISNDTTETGTTATFTVALNTEPTADVVITLDSDNTNEGTVDLTELTFTSGNWDAPQTVTVTGQDDDIDDGDVSYQIILDPASSADLNYDGANPADVDVLNIDNDTADVTVTESGGSTDVTEDGATDTYEIVLTSEPTATVTIDIDSGAQLNVLPASLDFDDTNWDTPQVITVSAEDDTTDEDDIHTGTISHVVTSVDAVYDGFAVPDVVANVEDNDVAGGGGGGGHTSPPVISPSHMSVLIENGAATTPDAEVTVTVSAQDATAFQLSNTTNFSDSAWMSYQGDAVDVSWDLERDSGTATVYARFRSQDDAVSSAISDSIQIVPGTEEQTPEEPPTEEPPSAEPPIGDAEGLVTGGVGTGADDRLISTFVRTVENPAVFALLEDGTLRVMPNLPTFLTYADGCQDIQFLQTDSISEFPISGSVWVNSGVVLVKFVGKPEVFVVTDDPADPWKRVLRWIPDEEAASANFGPNWNAYVLEVEENPGAYTFGPLVKGLEFAGMAADLRSRAALYAEVSYELSIENGETRLESESHANVKTLSDGVSSFSFEDSTDNDYNDVVLQVDPTNCLTFDIAIVKRDAMIHHQVWLTVYWGGMEQGSFPVFEDSADSVQTTAVVNVANQYKFTDMEFQNDVEERSGLFMSFTRLLDRLLP